MTRDDIILMAREVGLTDPDLGECVTDYGDATDCVLRFFSKAYAAGAAAEREACANVCEQIDTAAFGKERPAPSDCAAAIRARGQA